MSGTASDFHPIRIAARYSGLSAELIRAWERRYQVISPKRVRNGRRMYSNKDIERLSLLAKAVATGRRISDIAKLSDRRLLSIIERDQAAIKQLDVKHERQSTALVMEYFDRCTDALHKFNLHALVSTFDEAERSLRTIFFIEDLVGPLMSFVRDECRRGAIANTRKRWLFDVISSYLTRLSAQQENHARRLVAYATESDAEMTALRASAAANSFGWGTIHLDRYVSPEDTADSFNVLQARLLIIGYGSSGDHDYTPNQFRKLRALLPNTPIIAVTTGAPLKVVEEVDAVDCGGGLQQLQLELEKLRD